MALVISRPLLIVSAVSKLAVSKQIGVSLPKLATKVAGSWHYPAYITNMSTGFFIGQPVAYKSASEDEKEISALLEIFKYNDEHYHNLSLAEEASITGEAYEVLYTDADAQIRFNSIPSEEMVIVCDSTLEQNIICAIRHFKIYDFNQVNYSEFIDVYNAKEIQHYFDNFFIVEYANNKNYRGNFFA